jgi:hypothetical protein
MFGKNNITYLVNAKYNQQYFNEPENIFKVSAYLFFRFAALFLIKILGQLIQERVDNWDE